MRKPNDTSGPSKRIPPLALLSFALGLVTTFTLALAIVGSGAVVLGLFGLAMGAIVSNTVREGWQAVLGAEPNKMSGRSKRFRLAFLVGGVFGVVLGTGVVVADEAGRGGLLLLIGLFIGGGVGDRVRKALKGQESTQLRLPEGPADSRTELFATAWLLLGVVLGGGV